MEVSGGMGNQVLRTARQLGQITPGMLARRLIITEKRAGEICLGMMEDGFLARNGKDHYKITMKGKTALDPWRYQGGIGRVPVSTYP